jgi:hypothetical protein
LNLELIRLQFNFENVVESLINTYFFGVHYLDPHQTTHYLDISVQLGIRFKLGPLILHKYHVCQCKFVQSMLHAYNVTLKRISDTKF